VSVHRTGMREVQVTDPAAPDAVLDGLRRDVVMVQMPTVFVLLAPPNCQGVDWLNRCKSRRPNKNYGTALGSLEKFHAMASASALPPELDSVEQLQAFTGAFLRFAVAPEGLDSAVVRRGTHQGLLLQDGPHRQIFKAVEADLERVAEPAIFAGHRFGAPLCTSANVSGDPDGSITNWERAYEFGVARNIPLVVRCEPTPELVGSYPIFWLQRDRVRVVREGPDMERIKARLPARLREEHREADRRVRWSDRAGLSVSDSGRRRWRRARQWMTAQLARR